MKRITSWLKDGVAIWFALILAIFAAVVIGNKVSSTQSSEWLGFAGNFAGSAFGIVGAILALEYEARRRQRHEHRVVRQLMQRIERICGKLKASALADPVQEDEVRQQAGTLVIAISAAQKAAFNSRNSSTQMAAIAEAITLADTNKLAFDAIAKGKGFAEANMRVKIADATMEMVHDAAEALK